MADRGAAAPCLGRLLDQHRRLRDSLHSVLSEFDSFHSDLKALAGTDHGLRILQQPVRSPSSPSSPSRSGGVVPK